jgi:8-oxo-dGTP pyrophosphatase MutT (NUDIX family)
MSTDPPKSEPRLTGPKRRSAGVVVLRRFDGDWRCLLLRCYRYWDFPRGEIEPGEDPLLAARREVAEETSLQTSTFAGVRIGNPPMHQVATTPNVPQGSRPRYQSGSAAQSIKSSASAWARRRAPERAPALLEWVRASVEG